MTPQERQALLTECEAAIAAHEHTNACACVQARVGPKAVRDLLLDVERLEAERDAIKAELDATTEALDVAEARSMRWEGHARSLEDEADYARKAVENYARLQKKLSDLGNSEAHK